MRKRIIGRVPSPVTDAEREWLDLSRAAEVEVTSETPDHPIESALLPAAGGGWRAAEPGEQTIRLRFDQPTRLRRIRVSFRDADRERTQEFLLRWSPDGGRSYRDIVRQQFNFSPSGSTRETEDYSVSLDGVTALELRITPDIRGIGAVASMEQLRLM